jgi:hypothetical protein
MLHQALKLVRVMLNVDDLDHPICIVFKPLLDSAFALQCCPASRVFPVRRTEI